MIQLPGKNPIEVKDRDMMAKQMNQFANVIGSSDKIDNETKKAKILEFFALNEKALNSLGPEIYLRVKNEFGDVVRRLGD